MCQRVFLAGKDTIETSRDLAALLGVENIVFQGNQTEVDDCCLCWVDIEASAKKAGWTAEPDPFGFTLKAPEDDESERLVPRRDAS